MLFEFLHGPWPFSLSFDLSVRQGAPLFVAHDLFPFFDKTYNGSEGKATGPSTSSEAIGADVYFPDFEGPCLTLSPIFR